MAKKTETVSAVDLIADHFTGGLEDGVMSDRDKPSQHGKILGQALALISGIGRRDAPFPIPECCLTCAFREGCMTNQMAGTGKVALDCVLGIDRDRFSCHHGMKDGEPTKICAGYVAALLAPWSQTMLILETLKKDIDGLEGAGPDEVRAAFDRWLDKIDPKRTKNDYELARLFARKEA